VRVVVEVLGPLRKYPGSGAKRIELDLPDGATVHDLLVELEGAAEPMSVSWEGKLVDGDVKLSEGACLLVFAPIAGG